MTTQQRPFGPLALKVIAWIGSLLSLSAAIANAVRSHHRTIQEACETVAKPMSCDAAHGSSGLMLALCDGLILGLCVAALYAYLISLSYPKETCRVTPPNKPRQIAWTCIVITLVMVIVRGLVVNIAAFL